MKNFEEIDFSIHDFETQLNKFKTLLDNNPVLGERADLLPFFRENNQLPHQLASIYMNVVSSQLQAFEYDIFGDFKCDFAAGSLNTKKFCFIEFEDAKGNSIFKKQRGKYLEEFAPRYEKGYSQIVDWFYKLSDNQNSDSFDDRFGSRKIDYEGILVIGRSQYLTPHLKRRLDWRNNNVIVASKRVHCLTYDDMYNRLFQRLHSYKSMERSRVFKDMF